MTQQLPKKIRIGTCSWKYDSWKGLVYSDAVGDNYLTEYARMFPMVEVDQWFWSLFGEKVVLPKPEVAAQYAASVPKTFRFSVKVPNAITLTHHYTKGQKSSLEPNPNFLSGSLFDDFIKLLDPLSGQIDSFIFQFEYLNKKKMPNQGVFQQRLRAFFKDLPSAYRHRCCIETRNPGFLNKNYFGFLESMGLHHVFMQGYWMPSIFEVYEKFKHQIQRYTLIRLLGPDRKKIEQITKKKWHCIVDPKDRELEKLTAMIKDLQARQVTIGINVNNHYEGSAPLTIKRFLDILFKDTLNT